MGKKFDAGKYWPIKVESNELDKILGNLQKGVNLFGALLKALDNNFEDWDLVKADPNFLKYVKKRFETCKSRLIYFSWLKEYYRIKKN